LDCDKRHDYREVTVSGSSKPGKAGASAGNDHGPASAGTNAPHVIRNVALVGHSGAGKTTLVESLLLAAGAIPRAGTIEAGTTVCDFDTSDIHQQRSVSLAVAPVIHDGVKVNLLDTPGYADYVGELRAGLRAADAALFVVSAVDGVDGTTQLLWEECATVGMPRAVVVTKLDHPRGDFEQMVAICQRVFGEGVLPLYLPMHADDGTAAGVIGLLSQQVSDYSTGTRMIREPDSEHVPLIQEARGALIEGIIAESEDETLMDRYLGGEDLDIGTLIKDLETAVARGSFYPVLCAGALNGLGTGELLEILTSAFPSPQEHPMPVVTRPDGSPAPPLTASAAGPLVAEVIQTTTDPYVGRVSLVRVFSGELQADLPVHVSGHGRADSGHPDHDIDEKIGALSTPLGKTLTPITGCAAGDICAVTKLAHAETGDTLSGKDDPLLMEPWDMPQPQLPVAVRALSKVDEDKLSTGLGRLVAEDPTLRLEHNVDTGQIVLWCLGEAHAGVLLDRLKDKYGVQVTTEELRVPLRETFASPATAMGRHVKQSGGHGQYAVCHIEVEPLASGAGFEFVDKVVGGAVPRQFIPSVEKGLRTQMERGVSAGYPLVDIRVTLTDGKSHSVDSSDMAFQMAGGLALKEAAKASQIALLEPVLDIAVLVPDDYVGAVMSDLSGRRGRVVGTEPVGAGGRTLVRAEVPELEIVRYAIELRSLSHGTASFTRTYLRHETMPSHLIGKVAGDHVSASTSY
jgi:elongation factor G